MQLPDTLKKAIEEEIEKIGLPSVLAAREELTDRYRQTEAKRKVFITTEAHRYAYLAARLPATYAAIMAVLQEVRARMPAIPIKSLLDLGAGPGTAMWAACQIFSEMQQITLIERDSHLMAMGKKLANRAEWPAIQQAHWHVGDLEQLPSFPEHDLIILSYSIGELPESSYQALIDWCWKHTRQFLVIIEPGTPVGFERIRAIRRHLIALGSHMVAPCPHAVACPMAEGDWCHFAARVERSTLHRRIKEGSLGYEDEKFSYVAVSKTPCVLPLTRVLRSPLKRSGHICLTLCTSEGVKQEIVSKKNGEIYKLARKMEWGSAYPPIDQNKALSDSSISQSEGAS